METAVELCRLAAKNRVDDLLVWQLAGVDLNTCDYDKRTPLHVVSVAREILISLVAIVTSDTSLKTSMILPSPPPPVLAGVNGYLVSFPAVLRAVMQRFFIGEKRCVTTPITHLNLIPDDELDENWSHISFNSDQRQSTYYGILPSVFHSHFVSRYYHLS